MESFKGLQRGFKTFQWSHGVSGCTVLKKCTWGSREFSKEFQDVLRDSSGFQEASVKFLGFMGFSGGFAWGFLRISEGFQSLQDVSTFERFQGASVDGSPWETKVSRRFKVYQGVFPMITSYVCISNSMTHTQVSSWISLDSLAVQSELALNTP